MKVQAEISLYPLRIANLSQTIERFLGHMEAADVTVQPGNMSTLVEGNADAVFSAVRAAFETVAEDHQVVLAMKVSNACPSGIL